MSRDLCITVLTVSIIGIVYYTSLLIFPSLRTIPSVGSLVCSLVVMIITSVGLSYYYFKHLRNKNKDSEKQNDEK